MNLHQDIEQSKQNFCITQKNNVQELRLPVKDGRPEGLILDDSNVIILSDRTTSKYASQLSRCLVNCCTSSGRIAINISFDRFYALPLRQRNNPNFIYLVQVDISYVDAFGFLGLLPQFKNIFVFAFDALKPNRDIPLLQDSTDDIDSIVASLSDGFYKTRGLIAGFKVNEFLAITGGCETVCGLYKDEDTKYDVSKPLTSQNTLRVRRRP